MIKQISVALLLLGLAACGGQQTTTDFDEFFPWNPDRPGLKTTESGIQYYVVKEGPDDGVSPTQDDVVQVFYDGRLTDGTEFDGNFGTGRPAMFGLKQVIPGWTQGLQLMSEGDEYVFFIPSALGYGQTPRPGGVIKPGDDLVFRVELTEVFKPKPADDASWDKYTPWDSSNPDVKETGSGVEYVVLESGDAAGTSPKPNDTVVVLYEGRFAESGEMFDSAYKRGEPIMFPANGVIPGWQEALSLMKPGDRWLVHIPSDLAYGERGYAGAIPPNSDLNFEVELIDVLPQE